jgi:PAS domain S-box-containing protein
MNPFSFYLIKIKDKIPFCFFVSLLCIYGVLHSFVLELNEKEIDYLSEKAHFVILVSSNNYPYEYIDVNNEISGIHVEFLKEILALTKSRCMFITEVTDTEPDIVSSLARFENLRFRTEPFYISDVYFLSKRDTHIDDIERLIVLNKEFLLDGLAEMYPDKKLVLYDDIFRAITLYNIDKQSALLFDNYNISNVQAMYNMSRNSVLQKLNDVNIKLFVTIDDPNLYNIFTKCKIILNEKNQFYNIYKSYSSQKISNILYRKYSGIIVIWFVVIVLLLAICLTLIYYYKIYHFKLEKLIDTYKQTNSSLLNEIDTLTLQAQSYKLSNNYLLMNIDSFAMILDINGNILFINQYVYALLGYRPELLIGHNIDEILSKENKQKILNLSIENTSEEKVKNRVNLSNQSDIQNMFEIEISSKEGLVKTFIFSRHYFQLDDTSVNIYCILHDVSDKKSLKNQVDAYNMYLDDLVYQRTKALKESEEQFKFVINSAYDSIFMIRNNAFTLVNDAFYTMTLWSDEKIKDKSTKFSDIIAPECRQELLDEIEANQEKQINHFVLNTKLLKDDGEVLDVEIHFTSVLTEADNSILGIIHDIAQKLEHEHQKLQAEKIKVLSQVAVTTNDQINSPLNAIQGYTELIEGQMKNPKPVLLKAFNNIYESIDKIKHILQQLVALTSAKSLKNITTEKYNYGDIDMISLDREDDANDEE